MEVKDSKELLNTKFLHVHRPSENMDHVRTPSYNGIRRFSDPSQHSRARSTPAVNNKFLLTSKIAQYDIINHYVVLNTIGQGSFSRVIQVLSTIDHKHYACKVISRKTLRRHAFWSSGVSFENEVKILKAIDHPRITKLYDVLDDPNADAVYLEPLLKTTPLEPSECLKVFGQMIDAVQFLHINKIIHCDIKPDNILVCFSGNIKLTDFGMSICVPNKKTLVIASPKETTPAFTPPEVRQFKQIDGSKIDIFALGVTLYCLFHGHLPWESESVPELYEIMANNEPHYPDATSHYHILLRELLYKDPLKRTSFQSISKLKLLQPYLIPSSSKSTKLSDLFKKLFQ